MTHELRAPPDHPRYPPGPAHPRSSTPAVTVIGQRDTHCRDAVRHVERQLEVRRHGTVLGRHMTPQHLLASRAGHLSSTAAGSGLPPHRLGVHQLAGGVEHQACATVRRPPTRRSPTSGSLSSSTTTWIRSSPASTLTRTPAPRCSRTVTAPGIPCPPGGSVTDHRRYSGRAPHDHLLPVGDKPTAPSASGSSHRRLDGPAARGLPHPATCRFIGVEPTKEATNVLAGVGRPSVGVPTWRIRPFSMIAIRSASASASAWSWVTKTVVTPSSVCSSLEERPGLQPQPGVEVRQRLVEQEHLRPAGHRPRQRDPLLLAAGELAGPPLQQAAEREPDADLGGGAGSLSSTAPSGSAAGRRCCRRPSCAGTARSPGRPWRRRRSPGGTASRRGRRSRCAAGVRRLEARDRAQESRLAAAGRAEQREELPVLDREVEVVDGPHATAGSP